MKEKGTLDAMNGDVFVWVHRYVNGRVKVRSQRKFYAAKAADILGL